MIYQDTIKEIIQEIEHHSPTSFAELTNQKDVNKMEAGIRKILITFAEFVIDEHIREHRGEMT